jgi:hypothetical protein
MARRRRRSPARRPSRAPMRKKQGFLASPAGMSAVHAVMGAGVGAALGQVPAVANSTKMIPGGSATAVAAVMGVLAVTSKSAKNKKMFASMAVGAAGFALVDTFSGSDAVAQLAAPLQRTENRVVAALPMQRKAPNASVAEFVNASYVN